jgi:hypothetical protein
MASRTCRICGRVSPPERYFTQGRCQMCAQYWRRHGVERPRDLPFRTIIPPRPCQICGQAARLLRQGRCGTCYYYWHRTGRERPPELWQR